MAWRMNRPQPVPVRATWVSSETLYAVLGLIVVVMLGGLSIVGARYFDPHSFRSRDAVRTYENEPIMKELAEQRKLLEEIRDR